MDPYDRALGAALTALALLGLTGPALALRDRLEQVTTVTAPDAPGPAERAASDDESSH
ncbi:hypothetical protein [Streptomyces katsurahamanus]|uniref:hypothetical protein n=1 Tax=Streptomyces katsurahamanus TaxID=2577098 RepID=UPI0012955EBD|nr:hypothetical protein [Streptomyces katsurahamanus]